MIRMQCPRCNKRICDISREPLKEFAIELRCPHCGNIVKVDCFQPPPQKLPPPPKE